MKLGRNTNGTDELLRVGLRLHLLINTLLPEPSSLIGRHDTNIHLSSDSTTISNCHSVSIFLTCQVAMAAQTYHSSLIVPD